jgi:uncharacterized protein (TIGR02594 family)
VTFPQGTLPRLIQVALAEVGTAETGNNETKYGKFMKADKLPWCGSFLNWCAHQAGVKVPNVVSTRAGAEAFQKSKQWHTTPKIGDFVFFDFIIDDKITINHIGLVIRASEKQIVTIEGNTSVLVISAMVEKSWSNQELWEHAHLWSVTADLLMSHLPVNYRIDQKEKNNGASKSNCSIMGAVIHCRSFGRVHGWWLTRTNCNGWRGSCCAGHFALAQPS